MLKEETNLPLLNGQMYRFIEKYLEHKLGDKLREHFHTQCGD